MRVIKSLMYPPLCFMFGEYDKLKKTLETDRYSNKFNGLVISDSTTPVAELDCFKIPVSRVTIYN